MNTTITKRMTLIAAGIAVVLQLAACAQPDTPTKPDTAGQTDAATLNRSAVRELGTGEATKITSRGQSIPLLQAVQLIVQGDWSVQVDKSVNLKTRLSWSGTSEPWTKVLADALQGTGIHAIVDWTTHTVSINRDNALPVATIAP